MRLPLIVPWAPPERRFRLRGPAGATSGCVYRITVQQGNFLEKRNTDQLTSGMTKVQVRYLLGTPMVPSIFI